MMTLFSEAEITYTKKRMLSCIKIDGHLKDKEKNII